MTSAEAKRLAMISTVAVGGLVAINELASEKGTGINPLRVGIGLAVTGAFLTLGAELAPGIAGPFAVLFLVSGFVAVGATAFNHIADATGGATAASSKGPTRQ